VARYYIYATIRAPTPPPVFSQVLERVVGGLADELDGCAERAWDALGSLAESQARH